MDVVSRPRVPCVARKGSPAPTEVLFKRGVGTAGVAARGFAASIELSPARCGGVAVGDRRNMVLEVLNVLRGVGRRNGCVARRFVASESQSVASEFQSVASQSEFVASVSQSTEFPSARMDSPSSTLPLVLKALVRRAAAAKVSRVRRRLEDALSRRAASAPDNPRSGAVSSCGVASRSGNVASVASRTSGVALSELSLSAVGSVAPVPYVSASAQPVPSSLPGSGVSESARVH
jgi:hypothetical protein